MGVHEQAMLLSRSEKLKLMEALWVDLSDNEEDFSSPTWHADVLRETEDRYLKGKEPVFDWDEAKKILRSRA